MGEFRRFLVVGGGAALLDLVTYLLLKFVGVSAPIAKGTSFVVASAVAYQGNKHFTYRRKAAGRASVLAFGLLYAATLALNVLVNQALLSVLPLRDDIRVFVAWALATAASASVNFAGTKMFIFRGERLS